MIRKVLLSFILLGEIHFSQQQIDIHWPTLANSPWPMIAHDPQLTGRSPYSGPKTPTIKWTLDLPYGVFSGPTIDEQGRLYVGAYSYLGFIGDTSNYFYAINPEGTIEWTFKTETPYSNSSGYLINNEGTIFFGSASGWLYAIDSSGNLKWKYDTGGFITQRVMNTDLQGNIYLVNYIPETNEKNLISMSKEGELNWKKSYGGGFPLRSPSISPDGNTIYIVGEDRNIYALNLDGKIKRIVDCVGIGSQPLMIDNSGNIYYTLGCSPPSSLKSIDSTGQLRWEYIINDSGSSWSESSPAIDHDGNIYFIYTITSSNPVFSRLECVDYYGNYKWAYQFEQEGEEIFMPLVVDKDGTIYCGSTWGYYYYAISNKGELLWKIPLNGYQVDNSTAIGSDGTLYIGTHKSSTHTTGEKTLIAIKDTGSVYVNEPVNEIKEFSLSQNFPNPFNPVTHIDYQLKERTKVTLKVFNIMGEEIRTLVDEEQIAGYYSKIFNAENLPSGVYFYELITDKTRVTKKMVLLR